MQTEFYSVNLCIQFEHGKIWTGKNSELGFLSCREYFRTNQDLSPLIKYQLQYLPIVDYSLTTHLFSSVARDVVTSANNLIVNLVKVDSCECY